MDIKAMIAAGESERLEFKASFGKDVIVSLAAFANTHGGRVIVGVADDGKVRGVNVGRETVQRYLNDIKIFDDRIVFTNPGRPFGNLTVEDLKRDDYVPAHRNRLLAEAFYLTGDIEKYGTGLYGCGSCSRKLRV